MKAYTVNQLGKLAGVSVRTLHYYDEIGLLKPTEVRRNGYRSYGENELLRLQQILFFRELEFPLGDIKRIIDSPGFDAVAALKEHRRSIERKRTRLRSLVDTIDKTLAKLTEKAHMEDSELYDPFKDEEQREYQEEAKKRWGNTDAYRQSVERVGKMTKAQMAELKRGADEFMKVVAATAGKGAKSPEMQALIAQHYESLKTFYEPNLEMYRGLAEMYVSDPRFASYYEKYKPGLAKVMREAMIEYCDSRASE